jgi:hypothetical protein
MEQVVEPDPGRSKRLRLQVRVQKYTGTPSAQAVLNLQQEICWRVILFSGGYRLSKSLKTKDFFVIQVLHLGCVTLFYHAVRAPWRRCLRQILTSS